MDNMDSGHSQLDIKYIRKENIMPKPTYRKPTSQVVKVFQGKELQELLLDVLQDTLSPLRIHLTQGQFNRFWSLLCASENGGTPVLIFEQYPLNSLTAHGKFKELIYARIRKTGNQYSKRYVVPTNPRTVLQQAQRGKFAQAVSAWQALSPADKQTFRQMAKSLPMTGFNLFVSNYLKTY